MTTAESPSTGRSSADKVSSKVGIGLVVVLALLALVAGMTSGSSSDGGPLLLAASAPTRVTVPAISASSTLVPTGIEPDGQLQVPPVETPMQAAWYDRSPTPGAAGPAIVLGHVNGGGKPGIFFNLKKVEVGQEVLIDRADGQTAIFTVYHVDVVPKDKFPTAAVYNDTSEAELRLVTCGGAFDRSAGSYEANVLVFASLTSVRPTTSAP
ncbi:class F sortase [Actinomycetospora sp. CA-101289]|uniref:class F sortase n=1 Tax=Actinomycetospora sp. CA-101289 TaxID=3239893 RepID=UPI003D987984